jgi:hypothetical protein
MTVTIDSRVYRATFYGILNANGAFWTPLAFESEEKAEQHLRAFWKQVDREWHGSRGKFKIVPVRIQLTALASVGRNPEGQDPQGLGAQHEHAVPAAERAGAPTAHTTPGQSE